MVKKGQVWGNSAGEKFYIKDVWNGHSAIDGRVTFMSLQNTDEYFAGEVCSCSLDCFEYQSWKLKLLEENFVVDDKLKTQLKIDEINRMIGQHKAKINCLQKEIQDLESQKEKYLKGKNK